MKTLWIIQDLLVVIFSILNIATFVYLINKRNEWAGRIAVTFFLLFTVTIVFAIPYNILCSPRVYAGVLSQNFSDPSIKILLNVYLWESQMWMFVSSIIIYIITKRTRRTGNPENLIKTIKIVPISTVFAFIIAIPQLLYLGSWTMFEIGNALLASVMVCTLFPFFCYLIFEPKIYNKFGLTYNYKTLNQKLLLGTIILYFNITLFIIGILLGNIYIDPPDKILFKIILSLLVFIIPYSFFIIYFSKSISFSVKALYESEQRFKDISLNVADTIWETGKDIEYTFCSENFSNILGYNPNELIGNSPFMLLHPDEDEKIKEYVLNLTQNKLPIKDYEVWSKTKQGDRVCLRVNAIPLLDDNGDLIGYRGVDRDITNIKKNEESLKESELKYRMLADNASDLIWTMDMNLKATYLSPSIYKLIGFTVEEAMSQPLGEMLTPDSLNKARNLLKEELAFEKDVSPDESRYRMLEVEQYKKDGSILWFELTAKILRDHNNNLIGIMGISRNIDERKQVEKALQESEQRFKDITYSIGDRVWEINDKAEFTYCSENVQQLFGYRSQEMIKKNPLDFCAHEEVERLKNYYKQIRKNKEPIKELESWAIKKDGSKICLRTSGVPILNDNNEITGYRGVDKDITKTKLAESMKEALTKSIEVSNAKLKQSNQNLEDFVYIASHDLQEPLRKITAFGKILMESLNSRLSSDEQENLNFIIDGAGRLKQMIDGLLAYSQISTKTNPIEKINMVDIVQEIENFELSVLLKETKGKIIVTDSLSHIYGDTFQIRQLMQNLIGNGVKYYKKDLPPEVTVRSKILDNEIIKIEVVDNGIGIEGKYTDEIFTMFRRLHSRSDYRGAGIGLSICKKIVERHHGAIGVESTLGKGSTFWFTIPYREAP